jgi:hypothetical protein
MASSRKPLSEVEQNEDMTVEQFLERQCETIIDDLRQHSAELIGRLKREYADGAKNIAAMMATSSSEARGVAAAPAPTAVGSSSSGEEARQGRLCVTLKTTSGPHMGQRFRLEATTESGDAFKIGRSTGKAFKEKGLSLYKDREISTSHAKIEIKNSQVFFVDTKSTNGTALNGESLEANVPYRLKTGDVVSMGGTDLLVTVSDQREEEGEEEEEAEAEGDENFASV